MPASGLTISNVRYCIECANAVNQYLAPFTEPTDEGHCTVLRNLVTGQMARCVELRALGVPASRCGEAGALFVGRETEVL